MKLIIALVLIIGIIVNGKLLRTKRNTTTDFKICVHEKLMIHCNEMAAQETMSPVKISCISGRDRIQCIDKVGEGQADFTVVDPEDMYIAANIPNQNFTIFEEIRTIEDPEAEFEYEGVAVIHTDLKIDDIKNIKGLKSCHPEVGIDAGYKILITKLINMGVIENVRDPELLIRENELKTLSKLFSEACIVGQWSSNLFFNDYYRKKYSNLCQLCEDPSKCDYPDNFAGYEGALRCLAHNGGEIAWTTAASVKKFFGLSVGNTSARHSDENPNNFAYLCLNGTKVPITGTPCRWAARPWQGYLINSVALKSVNDLRKKLLDLHTIGSNSHAIWLEKILKLNNETLPIENKLIGPRDNLDKANYTDVIERDNGPPFRRIRFCVTSTDELKKCKDLSRSAFSRDIRPMLDCVEEKTIEDCFSTIRDNGADIMVLHDRLVKKAVSNYNLRPLLSEYYRQSEDYFEVAIIRKNSTYNSFSDLKGAKACFSEIGEVMALNTLINLNLIEKRNCPLHNALSEYFSEESFLFGSNGVINNKTEERTNLDAMFNEINSNWTSFGNTDALKCLVERQGDVAFLKHSTFRKYADGKNEQHWASNLKSEDYELLCESDSRGQIDHYRWCHLGKMPSNKVVTSNSKSDAELEEIIYTLFSISYLYGSRPELFRIFGPYNNKSDLLFKDSAIGIQHILDDKDLYLQKIYTTMKKRINICEHKDIILRNGTEIFNWWAKPPVTPSISIYFYNVTNSEEFLNNGSKPILDEIGPYVYNEKWERIHITFNDNKTLVSYNLKKNYTFNKHRSTGTEDDLLLVPNIPMLSITSISTQQARSMRLAIGSIISILKIKPFVELSVKQLLWGYEDPFLRLAKDVFDNNEDFRYYYSSKLNAEFGLLYNKNGTTDDRVSVFTGDDDLTKYGLIKSINGKSKLDHWLTDTCNSLSASDGSLFPPHISKNTTLYYYNEDLCRTLPLVFEKEIKREDNITTWRFTPPSDVFDSADKNPYNECFCSDGPPCSPSGLFNASLCFEDSRMLSFPHFYLAEESIRNAFEGITPPDPEKHKLYVDVQPNTGSAMSVTKRIQINLAISQAIDIEAFEKFPDIIFPIMWYEDSVNYHPEEVTKSMKLINKNLSR